MADKDNKLVNSQDQQIAINKAWQKDLVLYNPENCFKHSSKIKTVADVFKLNTPTLGDMKRKYGKDRVLAYIELWLINLNDSSNVKNKMNDGQIMFCAQRIFETYSLTIADLTLFFRNIKEGVYGQYYENLSMEKIMEWLGIYFDQRCEMAQMQSGQNHKTFSMLKDKMNPEVVKKMFDGVGETKIDHSSKGGGLGSRTKGVVNICIDEKIDKMSTDELVFYLMENGPKTNNYIPEVYSKISVEVDKRQDEKHGWTDKRGLKTRVHRMIDDMVEMFDRQMLEDTIEHWSEMDFTKPFLGYLKSKRKKMS